MSHETPSKAEKMLKRYEDRLREIMSIDLEGLKINEIRELTQGFELEMQTLDSKKASVLSTGTRAILKDRYFLIIRDYKNVTEIPNLLDRMERVIASYYTICRL